MPLFCFPSLYIAVKKTPPSSLPPVALLNLNHCSFFAPVGKEKASSLPIHVRSTVRRKGAKVRGNSTVSVTFLHRPRKLAFLQNLRQTQKYFPHVNPAPHDIFTLFPPPPLPPSSFLSTSSYTHLKREGGIVFLACMR